MLRCKLLNPHAKPPTIAHPGEDLGYDLYAAETVVFPAKGHAVVPTGVAIELTGARGEPMGALVRDRSSMASRRIITTAGVIDAGYRGEVLIVMTNLGQAPVEVKAGEKIAQMIPVPVLTGVVEEVDGLEESARQAKGFGSSGR